MSQYFLKQYGRFNRNVKVELEDLSNYAKNADLKEAAGGDRFG